MRSLEFRAAFAAQLLGRPELTTAQIRNLSERSNQARLGNLITYSGRDILVIKDKLDKEFLKKRELKSRPPVVASRMSKGGVGKSCISVNIAMAMALQGWRVLFIDADPQGTATTLFGEDKEDTADPLKYTLMSVLLDGASLSDGLIQPYSDLELSLLPCDIFVSQFDMRAINQPRRELLLNNYLDKNEKYLSENFDIIIVDTGPSSNMLNFNIMLAADLLVAPMLLDGLSEKALAMLQIELNEMNDMFKVQKPVLFVANGFHKAHNHSKKNLADIKIKADGYLAKTVLPNYVGFGRQVIPNGESRPIIEREPNCEVTSKLISLSREVAEAVGLYRAVGEVPVVEEGML